MIVIEKGYDTPTTGEPNVSSTVDRLSIGGVELLYLRFILGWPNKDITTYLLSRERNFYSSDDGLETVLFRRREWWVRKHIQRTLDTLDNQRVKNPGGRPKLVGKREVVLRESLSPDQRKDILDRMNAYNYNYPTRLQTLAIAYEASGYKMQGEVVEELSQRFSYLKSKIASTNGEHELSLDSIGYQLIEAGYQIEGLVLKNLFRRWEHFGILPKARVNDSTSKHYVRTEQLRDYFTKNPNRVITVQELELRFRMNRGAIKQAIHRLRLGMEENPKDPNHVILTRGYGYRYVP